MVPDSEAPDSAHDPEELPARVFVVDDEPGICRALDRFFGRRGETVQTFARAEDALAAIDDEGPPALVILDVRLPGMSGIEALGHFRALDPPPAVLVVTAHGTLDVAVEAMRRGALDYLPKPLDLEQVGAVAQRALESRPTIGAAHAGAPGDDDRGTLLVGHSPAMQDVFKRIGAVALADVPVLLLGESGSGKEMVARAIHEASRRSVGPFEPVDCASLPESLLEGELFGHERGAFTGAVDRRIGRLERANGGTLFLDEVAEIPLAAQAKLLRFLETRRFERLGGSGPVDVEARILAATHRDLPRLMAEGRFREDLYYRLDVVTIRIPPLRDRPEDIPQLVAHFLAPSRDPAAGTESTGISRAALERMMGYAWPGNVRELRNAVEHARVLARGEPIQPEHLPGALAEGGARGVGGGDLDRLRTWVRRLVADADPERGDLHARAVAAVERPLIEAALERTGGNQVQAARLLGIHRTTLRDRMQRWDMA